MNFRPRKRLRTFFQGPVQKPEVSAPAESLSPLAITLLFGENLAVD
jgi:hypothetical protein